MLIAPPKICTAAVGVVHIGTSTQLLLLTNIIHNKPTRCNYGSIVFINNYKYALHVSDDLCFHHQEHYKL